MCTQIKIQTIYFTDKLPDLPEVFPETSASNKRIYNDTSFDASDSLFSTMDASAVIKLNPPRKKPGYYLQVVQKIKLQCIQLIATAFKMT